MTYQVKNDIMYINFIRSKPNTSKHTQKGYLSALSKLTKANEKTLTEIIETCKNQQDKIIEKTTKISQDENTEIVEKTITQFDVNTPESHINTYLNNFINYCKNRNNKNTTINNNLTLITAFLSYYKVKTPSLEKFTDDTENWHLLTKEDFRFILNDSTLTHASLIKFLMSSGMRLGDALSLTIGDFMTATKEYHSFVDVEDFIDNAPNDMIGSWTFHPSKTRKHNIKCQTFNDPESSNLILQNLRRIKNTYNPWKNKQMGLQLRPNKSDSLFGSQKSYFKGPLYGDSLSKLFELKNDKLHDYHVNRINQLIEDKKLSQEDFDNEVSKIPKFHAHACRKYFQTMISHNCGDLRICTLLEGHTSPVKTDKSYIKLDIQDVKEAYRAALPDLSLENVEAKVYTSEVRREMEEKINLLEKELESKTSEATLMNDRLSAIEEMIYANDGLVNVVDKFKK